MTCKPVCSGTRFAYASSNYERGSVMLSIVIYRKDLPGKNWSDDYATKPGKNVVAQAQERRSLTSRVDRPELVEFFESGSFYKLPALSTKIIDNKPERMLSHRNDCWVVPAGSLGRVADKVATGDRAAIRSASQSVLLWIKQNLGYCVNPDHVSVVAQEMP